MYKLKLFPSYPILVKWRQANRERFLEEGAIIQHAQSLIIYPNGDHTLLMVDPKTPEDFLSFISCRFDEIEGTNNPDFDLLLNEIPT